MACPSAFIASTTSDGSRPNLPAPIMSNGVVMTSESTLRRRGCPGSPRVAPPPTRGVRLHVDLLGHDPAPSRNGPGTSSSTGSAATASAPERSPRGSETSGPRSTWLRPDDSPTGPERPLADLPRAEPVVLQPRRASMRALPRSMPSPTSAPTPPLSTVKTLCCADSKVSASTPSALGDLQMSPVYTVMILTVMIASLTEQREQRGMSRAAVLRCFATSANHPPKTWYLV